MDYNKLIDDIFQSELDSNTSKIHVGTAKILALTCIHELIKQQSKARGFI